MTPEATKFVASITFQAVTGRPAYADMWAAPADMPELHVGLARSAELMIIAPVTATMMARLSLGLAEDLVSLTALATRAPMIICPAMDANMWEHPATQSHVDTLWSRGIEIVGPEDGRLASGRMGLGRLSDVEKIMGAIRKVIGQSGDLARKKIVVSAGGTRENIDPVRFLGNESSGKMGWAVAEAARDRGAHVTLVSGPADLADPYGVRVLRVRSAAEMRDIIVPECKDADAVIMAAAVADYQAADPSGKKLKRAGTEGLTLSLVSTPDILAEIEKRPGLVRVGFAAESHDLAANAKHKLEAKGLDLIAANDITSTDAGFGTETNRVVLIDKKGKEELPLMTKYEVAWRILDRVAELVRGRA
jgi:phosphopantothenoylcysteine decarboxylase/phosphopantothenate--cysteine ligase